jgi:hypothetical protein
VERGAALVPSAKKQGGLGTAIDVPLGHKDAAYVRSHFDAIEARVGDAPRAGEILVAVAVTTGRYKTAVNATCDASSASATAAITGSYVMGTTMEESSGAGDLALIDIHPQGIRPGTLA